MTDSRRSYKAADGIRGLPADDIGGFLERTMTPAAAQRLQQAELARVHRAKVRAPVAADPLGPALVGFFKQSVAKRQTKLCQIAAHWAVLVPPTLDAHCALESLHRGSLTVLVDSSSHLYELKQLLLAGLADQLLLACKAAGLRKVTLKPGRWYAEVAEGRKLRFD